MLYGFARLVVASFGKYKNFVAVSFSEITHTAPVLCIKEENKKLEIGKSLFQKNKENFARKNNKEN